MQHDREGRIERADMIRYIFLALVLVATYGFFMESYLAGLYRYALWQIDFKADSQRRIFKIINSLPHLPAQSVIAFGGSATRELFPTDRNMTKLLDRYFLNAAVSSESPYDTLKLIELIPTDSIVLFGLHPKTFHDYHFDENQILLGYYLGGAFYKFPVTRHNEEPFIKAVFQQNNLPFTQTLFPMFNTYTYLFKTFIKNHHFEDIIKGNFWTNRPIKQYYYDKPPLPTAILEKKLDDYFHKGGKRLSHLLDLNFKLLEAIAQQAKEKRCQFIIIELPFSPIIQRRFHHLLPAYREKLNHLLDTNPEITFISLNQFGPFSQSLFYDTMHLRPEGRKYLHLKIIYSLKKAINAN